MERYRKVRAALVGHLRVTLDPADARLTVDGREVTPGIGGSLPVLSGEHVVRAERAGHDPAQQSVSVAAGQEQPLRLQLLPNARTVVAAHRARGRGGAARRRGRWAAPQRPEAAVGAGQRAAETRPRERAPRAITSFELRKECYRTERLRDAVTIDLLDRSPKVYKPVQMAPASSSLVLVGGPSIAQAFVDGNSAGPLPLEPSVGLSRRARVEVRVSGRANLAGRP